MDLLDRLFSSIILLLRSFVYLRVGYLVGELVCGVSSWFVN